jgi:IMP dehydrogenase
VNEELFDHFQALTFDDVLIVPGWSEVLPEQTDTSAALCGIPLRAPVLSAAMDTVTEAPLAVALAREGGLGILHRNLSVEDQATHVERVKRAQSGMLTDPITLPPTATLADAEAIMARDHISGVPVVGDDGRLQGILTNRDIRFAEGSDLDRSVADFMTADDLVTAPPGTTLEEAKAILHRHRIEKLPLCDADGYLVGLITVKDIVKRLQKPHSTIDERGRLRVGAAVGVNDVKERVDALYGAGVDIVVVDTAHGHSGGVVRATRFIKENWPELPVVAGNVVTAEGVRAMVEAGADAVKVGVGAGSICTTRVVAGAGMPQVTAIWECSHVARELGVPVIADGGITTSGDLVKAFVAGADLVMLGNLLAGVDEAPGELELVDGAMFKVYRGMGSAAAMRGRAADRYAAGQGQAGKHVPEGVEGRVRYAGSLADLLGQLMGGLRQGMGYAGAGDLAALRTMTRLVRITGAGLTESHPHDLY